MPLPASQAPTGELTLRDLLAIEPLGLRLVTGDDAALDRPVRGVHAIEIDDAARWLDEGWVMLTTGLVLAGDDEAQRRLVAELHDAGVAALGLALEMLYDEVPPALVAAAREHGLPVFSIPWSTPFREIVAEASRALISADVRLLRRVSAIQRFLMDGLAEAEPEQAVADRLARVLDAAVAVLRPGGGARVVAGRPPEQVLAYGRRTAGAPPPGVAEVAGWDVLLAAIPLGERRLPRTLLVAAPHRAGFDRLGRPVAQVAAPLLGAAARVLEAQAMHDLAVRRALLQHVLAPGADTDALALATRAQRLGIDFAAPVRVVAIALPAPEPPPGDEAVAVAFEDAGLAALCAADDDHVVALVQGEDGAVQAALERMLVTWPALLGGIGRQIASLGRAGDSHRDASLALERLRHEGRPGRLLHPSDFDVPTLLLSGGSLDIARPQLEDLVARLRARPALHEALVAYFDHNLDIAAAAAHLHLHPNSLRYRLARLEEVLGHSLKEPATIAALHIALVAEPLLKPA